MVVVIVWYLISQSLSLLKLWVRIPLRRGVLDTLCDNVCQRLVTGPWFSPATLVSSTNKTDRNDRTEILLKVALNTIKPLTPYYKFHLPYFCDYRSQFFVLQNLPGFHFSCFDNMYFTQSLCCRPQLKLLCLYRMEKIILATFSVRYLVKFILFWKYWLIFEFAGTCSYPDRTKYIRGPPPRYNWNIVESGIKHWSIYKHYVSFICKARWEFQHCTHNNKQIVLLIIKSPLRAV